MIAAALALCAGCAAAPRQGPAQDGAGGWPAYGGDPGGTRYSELAQIHRENAGGLALAWSYRTGELGEGAAARDKLTFEATPVLFEGSLVLSTAFGRVIALDPATGAERWTFDPRVDRARRYSELTSRGVSAWRDPRAAAGAACAARVFVATVDARLMALDARSGQPCADFGEGGTVRLSAGLGVEGSGDYQVTSPPAIADEVVIVGSSIGDNWHVDTGPGVVRGYDARTGALRWSWDPLPRQPGRVGAANAWAPLSVDLERGLVFVPTSSPSPDFYGGLRPGDDRHANSVVALRAATGALVWSFQTVHHDLWDYDLAAQPALVSIRRGGREIPAVVQATKTGFVFVLHRETGEPLFPVEERAVPPSTVPGEQASPTQPHALLPRPLMPQGGLGPDEAWGPTEADRQACRALLERHPAGPLYTPPTLAGAVAYPGNASGTNWGSVAYDHQRQLLVLNTSRLATFVRLVPQEDLERTRAEARAAGVDAEFGPQRGAPYAVMRYTLLSPSGTPCNPPPWGTLAAVDLGTGKVRWEVPLGEIFGIRGTPNAGGPIVTAGGLVFIGATMDQRFRAFDVETGAEVWSTALPASAIATPMTYRLPNGDQFVVIVAGGHGKMGLPVADHVLAFRLPR